MEQVEAERQERGAVPVGEEAEVADAHEAAREQVEEETAQELIDGQGHEPLLVGVSGISPAEGDVAVGEGNESVVGDGDLPAASDLLPLVARRLWSQCLRRWVVTHAHGWKFLQSCGGPQLGDLSSECIYLGDEDGVGSLRVGETLVDFAQEREEGRFANVHGCGRGSSIRRGGRRVGCVCHVAFSLWIWISGWECRPELDDPSPAAVRQPKHLTQGGVRSNREHWRRVTFLGGL